jgi:hypothetical protein
MPPQVADSSHWHCSASVCVGPGQHPGRIEWERRSGALLLGAWCRIGALRKKLGRGRPDWPTCPPGSFVRNNPSALPKAPGSGHNLGTDHFGASAPATSPPQNWSSDSLRSSRLSFAWIVPGFTEVCFWGARRRWIAALEGPVGLRVSGLTDSTLARLTPNRCLAGPPGPSCSTEN